MMMVSSSSSSTECEVQKRLLNATATPQPGMGLLLKGHQGGEMLLVIWLLTAAKGTLTL
jgi:hypothetical protein